MKKEIDNKQWEHLFEAYKESSIQFDKNILFISSGALGFSMTFIKEIVPLQEAIYISILIAAWSIFTFIIFASLLSYYLSMKAMNKEMQDLFTDEKHRNKNKLNKVVQRLNIIMLVGLPVGLIFLIIFITFNVSSKSNNQIPETKKTTVIINKDIKVQHKPVSK